MDRRAVGRVLVGLVLSVVLHAGPAWGQNENVTVNEQPTAEQRLAEVAELRRAGRHDTAAEVIQELIDDSALKLVGVGEGRYTDAERWCRQELMRDPALREAYVQRFTASATRALEQALAEDEPVRPLSLVYRQYSATRPGLEAGLELAGRMLESGEASSAVTLIQELLRHPDRGEFEGRVAMLRGAAAVYTRDADSLDAARERLTKLGLEEQAAWLDGLEQARSPDAGQGRAGLIDAGEKPDELRVSLWDRPITEVQDAARWARGAAVLPVVTPSLVVVNNGRQVVAMDRASGQRLWVTPEDDAAEVLRPISAQRWYDRRGVAVGEGVISAVLGECYGITENRNPYVPQNKLVCIDEPTGQVRWQRKAGDLLPGEPSEDPDRRLGRANLQLTHFIGTPIIANGQVFVLLRRANNHIAQTTWLMSYDLEDGSLRWFRHLAQSSLSYSNDSLYVMPQISLDGDTLYVSDSIATVGAVDIHSGGYRWLRVMPVGYGPNLRLKVETEGVVSPPVLTNAGLLVPLSVSHGRLALLDPRDGSTLQRFDAENNPDLGAAQYLMAGGEGVVVVSLSSVSFWDADQSRVVWTYTFDQVERAQGRGDVTRQFVIVPTNRRLLVLDRATGKLLAEADSPGGNVTVSDSEVFTTSSEGRIYSYTSWQRAYDRLVEKARQSPTDPTAGLALASLALRQGGKNDALMEGVGLALEAIDRQTPAQATLTRQRVFAQLRTLAVAHKQMDARTRLLLYDKLALATQTAAQEAAYHLDVGLFHADQGEIDQAIRHLQAVLAEPAYASQPYERHGVTRSAGSVAQQELIQLIEQYGRSAYRQYDALARARLAEVIVGGGSDPAALAMIARRYPMSPAAVEALLEAARTLDARGRQTAATGLYQQAVVQSRHTGQRQLAVGRLLGFYIANRRPDAAEALLELELRRSPDAYPLSEGQPLDPQQWRERIAAVKASPPPRPALAGSLDTPRLLPGKLVSAAPGIEPASLRGRLLLHHEDGTMTCRTQEDPGQDLWRAKLPVQAQRWQVLADGREQTLVWSPDAGWVVSMNPETGQPNWASRLVFGDHEPGDAAGLDVDEAQGGLVFALSDAVVCFGHRASARLVVLDRSGGGVLWRTELAMTELTAIDADAWTLAAAGRVGPFMQPGSGKLALLSLFTGAPVTDSPEININLSPIAVTLRRDRALVCGQTKVSAIDLANGAEVWTRGFQDEVLTGMAVSQGGALGLSTDSGVVHVLDQERAGRPIGQALVRGRADTDPITMQPIGGDIWVRGGRGLYRLGTSPVVRWHDAVSLAYKRPVRALVGGEHAALIAAVDPDQDPDRFDQPKSFGLFILDREDGRLLNQYMLGPIDGPLLRGLLDPTRAELFGTGLVVPVGWQTLVVPGAP